MLEQCLSLEAVKTLLETMLDARNPGMLERIMPLGIAFFSPLVVLFLTIRRDRERQRTDHEQQKAQVALQGQERIRQLSYEEKRQFYMHFLSVFLEHQLKPLNFNSLAIVSAASTQARLIASKEVSCVLEEFLQVYMPQDDKLEKMLQGEISASEALASQVDYLAAYLNLTKEELAKRNIEVCRSLEVVEKAMREDLASYKIENARTEALGSTVAHA